MTKERIINKIKAKGFNTEFLSTIIDGIDDWDYAADVIRPRLTDKVNNSDIPTVPFLDMDISVYIRVNDDLVMPVTKDMIKNWDITEADLFEIAFANIVNTYTISPLAEDMLYIASTKDNDYGAVALCNGTLLEQFAEFVNVKGFYVLPSSKNEVLFFINDDADVSESELRTLVEMVNATSVEPEEVLTNSIYYFNAEENSLERRMN